MSVSPRRISTAILLVGWLVGPAILLTTMTEGPMPRGAEALLAWLLAQSGWPLLAWSVLWPLAWLWPKSPIGSPRHAGRGAWGTFLLGLVTGAGAAAGFGWNVRDLPPLYHDEYSYLFQAQTFLAGRLSFPAPGSAAFDQMHVLTDPVYASRFFPGTGLWLAPFEAIDFPLVGMWLAAGLTAGFLGLAGRTFSPTVGWIAAILAGLSPAIIVFDNLLLSPGPTMLAMSLFLWTYFRARASNGSAWGSLAGFAMGAAFVTRPLTAAGLGLPFAIDSIANAVVEPSARRRLVAIAAPFAAAVVLLGGYNAAITGRPWVSPYGVYLNQYTPSHGFGFYNVERGRPLRGERTRVAYDDWAENLTPARAIQLVGERAYGVLGWSMFRPVLIALVAVAVLAAGRRRAEINLLVLSAVGLLVAYAPFAFPGLLGFGYAAEATPALLLLAAVGGAALIDDARARGRPAVALAWGALPLVAIAIQASTILPAVFEPSSELVFPRLKARERARLIQTLAADGPILVIVDARPDDFVHETLVVNHPGLRGAIVMAWSQGPETAEIVDRFPGRAVYRWRPDASGPGRIDLIRRRLTRPE